MYSDKSNHVYSWFSPTTINTRISNRTINLITPPLHGVKLIKRATHGRYASLRAVLIELYSVCVTLAFRGDDVIINIFLCSEL